MPKKREVTKGFSSISWTNCTISKGNRCFSTSIPKKEYEDFLKRGYKVEKIRVIFKK